MSEITIFPWWRNLNFNQKIIPYLIYLLKCQILRFTSGGVILQNF